MTWIFHGRIPYNILDHKLGLNPNPTVLPRTDFAEEFQRKTQVLFDVTKKIILQSYLKKKEYLDRKATASVLNNTTIALIYNLWQTDHQE